MKTVIIILLTIAIIEGWFIFKLQNTGQQVLLPDFSMSENYPNTSDDGFFATGSWISDTKLASTAQTTEISCYKELGYCFETNAQLLNDDYLSLNNDVFEITSWTKDEIVTKPNTSHTCVDYKMTIDRKNKEILSLRTTKNKEGKYCKDIDSTPIVLKLGDGQARQDKIKSQK